MWSQETRPRYNHDQLRYPSNLTDEEWSFIEPLISPSKHGGRQRSVNIREIVNRAHVYFEHGLPVALYSQGFAAKEYRPRLFRSVGLGCTIDCIHHELYVKCWERASHEASPTTCVIDSQSVKSAEKGGASIDPPGYDAGKKIKGRKRHILVDTLGLLLHAVVHSVDIKAAMAVCWLSTLFGLIPFSDSGYQGPVFRKAAAKLLPHVKIEITKRSGHVKGFELLPRRWVVERTIGWLNRRCRLAKDLENLNRNALAFPCLASIRLMLRKLCQT